MSTCPLVRHGSYEIECNARLWAWWVEWIGVCAAGRISKVGMNRTSTIGSFDGSGEREETNWMDIEPS